MNEAKVCKNCKHWTVGRTLSPVCEDGDVPSEQGPRKALFISVLGRCGKIVSSHDVKREFVDEVRRYQPSSPLDAIVADPYRPENNWGVGGTNEPQTGPNFGCIHFEYGTPRIA